MNNEYVLGMESEYLQKLVKTEQFKISEKILKKRTELNLSVEEMAKELKMDVDKYFDFEYAELYYSVEEYRVLLKQIENLDVNKYSLADSFKTCLNFVKNNEVLENQKISLGVDSKVKEKSYVENLKIAV